ncbi:hypothetical protein KIV56_17885 [Cryobacterium breve]|uniref:Uncharacterized protein n=1 Tax=Cryobacterium breve TaxID=1259258 RepID=A0ABY7NCH3_9MICO|nr:hypothetical protein [Cryobacterium breve]WBM79989.1 hypothetical protein KIV56_17885 [Cryobacterium breve]
MIRDAVRDAIRALWAFLASCPVPGDETLLATSPHFLLRLVDDGVARFDRRDTLTT